MDVDVAVVFTVRLADGLDYPSLMADLDEEGRIRFWIGQDLVADHRAVSNIMVDDVLDADLDDEADELEEHQTRSA